MKNKKEVLKEDLATLRAILVIIITSFFGAVGYAIINLNKLDNTQIFLGSFAIVLLFVSFVILTFQYMKTRKDLGGADV